MTRYQPIWQGEVEQVSSPFNQFPLILANSSTEFLLDLGRQKISLTMVFRV